ncbi:MAG: biopolymer transporter Tol [Verrucomicrobiota bacterium]
MHFLPRSRFILIAALGLSALAVQAAQPVKDLGIVKVKPSAEIGVRITSSSPEMQKLAVMAFGTHGKYKLIGSGFSYDIRFTSVAPTQVRVDVTKGAAGTPVISQTVAGTSARHALLRAADVAVEATNGLGLKGFFASKLTFIVQRAGNKGDVYVSDLFLGEASDVTRQNALTMMPRWSPDGRRIIYTSFFKSGAPDIFTVDPVSGRKDTFASFKGTNMGARFSPSGQQVTMICGDGTSDVWVANAQRPLNAQRKTRSDSVKSSPAWSPDGSRIVFSMEPGPQLYVMSASGGAPQRLTTGYSYSAEPEWSVGNPNKIACTVRDGGSFKIAVYDLQTKSAVVVSKAGFDALEHGTVLRASCVFSIPSWAGSNPSRPRARRRCRPTCCRRHAERSGFF